MQVLSTALKNMMKSKIRLLTIPLIIGGALSLLTLALGIANAAARQTQKDIKAKDNVHEIRVSSSLTGGDVERNQVEQISKMDGVTGIVEVYNIFGLLEEQKGQPIYDVDIYGCDFDHMHLEGADDFRGQNVSGIVLPDLTVELNGTKKMSDYIGRTVYFTYEYVKNEQLYSETTQCKVLGVYKTSEDVEDSPVYMSLDLVSKIAAPTAGNQSGIQFLRVSSYSGEKLDEIANTLNELNLKVDYNTTKQDYLGFLAGFKTVFMVVSCVIILWGLFLLVPTITNNLIGAENGSDALSDRTQEQEEVRPRINKMILIESFVFCGISILIATIFCVCIGGSVSFSVRDLFLHQKYVFLWSDLVRMIAVGALVWVGSSFWLIRKNNCRFKSEVL